MIVSYAQNREDILLEAFFPDIRQGVYVDVGANHPVNDSVTKLFYDKGWHGINVEPNQKLWRLLQSERPRDTNLAVGVAEKEGTFNFREYQNHGLSTFSREVQSAYARDAKAGKQTKSYTEYPVEVTTLQHIFEANLKDDATIHFMKIDIEGYEYEALMGNDWKRYRPMVICIESNHIIHDWRPLLKKQGYTKVFFDGLNDYYLANEESKRAEFFDYPNAVLIDKHIISQATAKELGLRDKKITLLQRVIEQQNRTLKNFQIEKKELNNKLRKQRRIRYQVKELMVSIDRAFVETIDGLIRYSYPTTLTQNKIESARSTNVMIALAQQADRQAFLTGRPFRAGLHAAILFIYKAIRKLCRLTAQLLWKGVKALKGMVKK
jgi:FkbM family methyltransferase